MWTWTAGGFVLGTALCFLSVTGADAQDQACGKPQTPPSKGFRIVGGGQAQNNSWPWACALVQEVVRPGKGMTYRQFCDCTLIDNQWVMTAGHCTTGLTKAQFQYYVKVYMGEEDLTKAMSNSARKFNVSQLIVHENFVMATKHADIALIKLDRKIESFDNDLRPACLPTHYISDGNFVQKGSKERKLCYIGGWGHKYEGENGKQGVVGSGTDKIKQTSVEIFNKAECKKKLPVTDTMFCAGFDQGGRDTCQGDSECSWNGLLDGEHESVRSSASFWFQGLPIENFVTVTNCEGGPLVCDDGDNTWAVHGIVSWGAGCARSGAPGVYTNVWGMKWWIHQQTGINFTSPLQGASTTAPAPAR